tara:strand:+ start:446 stop:1138 length:693 start_codon:yes stop_codon:yes gene_type:complete
MKEINQVVILAGGKGTRMREMTHDLPKPMVEIGGKPVLEHLINIFNKHGDFNFLICTGYLSKYVEDYFDSFPNVNVVYTDEETNTGGRVFKVADYLNENFIVTYGDGLANVNIEELIKFHNTKDNIGTITVTNPISRFGLVEFDDNFLVSDFIEKPTLSGFINIGFMIFNKKFIDYLDDNSTLESKPLTTLAKNKELNAFIHEGYFEPMDTYREYLHMNELWNSGNAPWK